MITTLMWIFTGLLIVFTLLDLKSKAIPSVLLTGTIFIIAGVMFENLKWAVLMGIIGLMIWEFSEGNKIAFGIADIKVMIMLGFFIPSLTSFLIVAMSFAVGQMFYIGIMRIVFKFDEELPFIPLFLVLWLGGLIAGGVWA